MKAIIPAAGYATRLYPLTEFQPKHLLPVVGKPIIAYVIEKIEELNVVDEIVIVTNEKFYHHFKSWARNFKCSIKIKVVNDRTTSVDDRLGAIGDMKFGLTKAEIDDDLLIISGDNLFDFSLVEMHQMFVEKQKSVISLYDVRTFEAASKIGVVELDRDDKIVGFVEKPKHPKSTLGSIGIYFYPKIVIKRISEYLELGNNPDAPGHLLEWLYKKEDVYGFIFDKRDYEWFDVGSLASYQEANKVWDVKVRTNK
ncbi:hypothetical protein CL622_07860 [archaeon]|nr:hypothetical protein [archaeon]